MKFTFSNFKLHVASSIKEQLFFLFHVYLNNNFFNENFYKYFFSFLLIGFVSIYYHIIWIKML